MRFNRFCCLASVHLLNRIHLLQVQIFVFCGRRLVYNISFVGGLCNGPVVSKYQEGLCDCVLVADGADIIRELHLFEVLLWVKLCVH